jgi:enamine deaminase RidA (YjgF/YER057c/UK114 family)
MMAIGADGYVVAKDISPRFDGLAHSGFAQASVIYGYAETLCAAAGTSLANVVRAQYFCSSVTEFPGIATAWRAHQGDRPHPFLCVQTPEPLSAPDATVIADFWIYIPD